jgi:predicted N-acetyltransferase YhbS
MDMTPQTAVEGPVDLRRGRPEDALECGRICYESFGELADRHGYPSDFPTVEIATGLIEELLPHPGFFSVVAEADGEVVGSNFLDERGSVAGLGPVTVRPDAQDRSVGRRLMEAALDRARDQGHAGVRLHQAAYNPHSLALYVKLGFRVREAMVCLQGDPVDVSQPGYRVRTAGEEDLAACNRVCRSVHGHDRSREVGEATEDGTALVVEHDGRITGYATDLAFFDHAVGETDRELKALIEAASEFGGPGILVPLGDGPLVEWCLDRGLRLVQVMNLMTMGLYQEPEGSYLPSISY